MKISVQIKQPNYISHHEIIEISPRELEGKNEQEQFDYCEELVRETVLQCIEYGWTEID